jgi:hypothetical protein
MASRAAGGDAREAGSLPWQGEAPPKSSQRAVWSGHLNRIRRPEAERSEEGGCKVVTQKQGVLGVVTTPPWVVSTTLVVTIPITTPSNLSVCRADDLDDRSSDNSNCENETKFVSATLAVKGAAFYGSQY